MSTFANYVNTYPDIKAAWDALAAGKSDSSHYTDTDYLNWLNRMFQRDASLNSAWNNPNDARYASYHAAFPTAIDLAKAHFKNHGAAGVPFTFTIGGIRYDGASEDSKAAWGLTHWNSYGKNEARILPGVNLVLYNNGNLQVNTNAIGTGGNNTIQKQLEAAIQEFYNAAPGGAPGTYLKTIENAQSKILNDVLSSNFASSVKNALDSYYTSQKIEPWNASTQGAQPPVRGFDSTYYLTKTGSFGAEATSEFNSALQQGDLDIIGRFSRNTYAHYHYTNYGKLQGARGNEAENAKLVNEYTEYLTDQDYQTYRDQVLGLSKEFETLQEWSAAQDPQVLNEWYNSLSTDQKQDYKDGVLDIPTLDYIPERLRDRVVLDKGGTTILEGRMNVVLGEKDKQQQQMFGALTIDSLRQSLAELRKAKEQEKEYDFYQGFPEVKEVFSINETIANSLLGDTGFGGILGWLGDTQKTQEGLEEQLAGVTGVPSRNSVVYNWQKWFDETLLKRYETGATFVDPNDPTKTYQIDTEFAKDYIDRYLKPRFNTSRSMSEFVSYIDVKQNEQNIFQTQSALDALRSIGDVRAKAYLDDIYRVSNPALGGEASVFDPDFYWNPTGIFDETIPEEKEKIDQYNAQKEQVEADYVIATTQGNAEKVPGTNLTWAQWAYNYGLDLNDRQQFAKLHYQVFGAANGYDPAKDLITFKQADDYIQQSILPVIADEKIQIGDITFLNFVTPEEFADSLLEGISPLENKEEWDKLLETLGLSGKDMGFEEVKQYIIEAFQTEAAKTIREGIKYLNEKRKTPTQKELGVEYIERAEDINPTDSGNETELYKIFREAGYQGTEDEFYDDFMPDVDRSEMELITQGSKGLQLSSDFAGLTSKDPFESVFSMEKLFAEEPTTTQKSTEEEEEAPSYFRLFDEDESEDYKSTTGQKILGEFTTLFKGFS